MKRFIIALTLVAVFGSSAFGHKAMAQDAADNHISLSVSDNLTIYTASLLGGALGSMFTAPFGMTLGEVKSYGCGNMSYGHSLGRRFRLGGDLSYSHTYMNFKDNSTGEIGSESNLRFIMAMVSGRCDYLRRKNFTFYGDVAAGAMAGIGDDISYSPAFQVNPLGFRFGGKVGGFLELGFGVRGFATAGIEFSF